MGNKVYENNGLTVSLGNLKLPASTMIVNLPAIKTCPNSTKCRNFCYARKAEKRFPAVLISRERNYRTSQSDHFVDAFHRLMDRLNPSLVRLHESGDTYDQFYADKLSEVAKWYKDVPFYAYTKSPYRPEGVHIIESLFPGGELNFGDDAYVARMLEKYPGTPVCPYRRAQEHGPESRICGTECKICLEHTYVLFHKH